MDEFWYQSERGIVKMSFHRKKDKPVGWSNFARTSSVLLLSALISTVGLSVHASAAAKKSQITYVNVESVALLETPQDEAKDLQNLPRGEEIRVVEWNHNGYSYVRCGESSGYLRSSDLKRPVTIEEYDMPLKGKINAERVNLRVRPETDASIVFVQKKGASVDVLASVEGWYKVCVSDSYGYIHADYIDVQLPSNATTSYKRLSMGMSGLEVVQLQQALKDKSYFSGDVNGSYGALTRDAVSDFQKKQSVTDTGIADADTQALLFAEQQ